MQNNYIRHYLTILSIFLFYIAIVSCKNSQDDYKLISKDYLASLLTPNGYYVDVVVPLKENRILIINATELLNTYKRYYSNLFPNDFEFLQALYSGKINNIENYLGHFTKSIIDNNIMKEYYENGIEFIITKYLQRVNNNDYVYKEKFTPTVVKIMFMNNYYLYYDDQAASFYFSYKLKELSIPENFIQ